MEQKSFQVTIPKGYQIDEEKSTFENIVFKPIENITQRVKTFQDAINVLGYEHPYVRQYHSVDEHKYFITDRSIIACLQLQIIVAALNEGWKPTFSTNEQKWYPWFRMTKHGVSFALANNVASHSYSIVGSRLLFKSAELAEYAGNQFIDIYKEWLIN